MTIETKTPSHVLLWPVFAPAVIVALFLVIGTVSNPDLAGRVFDELLAYITRTFGWFYMLAVSLFLIFIVGVAISKWGNIKLGPDHGAPQYSFPSWFAMLFSTGYGIALLFFGVAEPVLHYAMPPQGAAQTVDAAKQAMQIAFFHWGFHIWAIYGLSGLVLAYFAFRHGLPLSIRSALYPLIGDRIHGPIGYTIDVFAILATLFGIATTLGLSVAQINAGLHYLWPSIPISTTVQIIVIALTTCLTIVSVAAGLDRGLRRLAILNTVLAVALMLFVFLFGPSVFILEAFLQNTGSYLNNIIERTFNLQAYSRSDWIGNWTLFIFGWTISWAPFVGLFIARISRGRTIREFVLGVMFVPTIFTFLWFSIFGDTALHMIMTEGYTELIDAVQIDTSLALFTLLEALPLSSIVSFMTVVLIVVFFVTSSDSASLVNDWLASGGSISTPVWQRVFWAVLGGVLASGLLLAGGLSALQTMSVTSALPYAFIMLVAAVGMARALTIEQHHEVSLQNHMQRGRHGGSNGGASQWKKRLNALMTFPNKEQVERFIGHDAYRAMRRVADALAEQGWDAKACDDEHNHRAYIEIIRPGVLDFIYEVRVLEYPMPAFVAADPDAAGESAEQYYRAEVFLRRGGRSYDVYGYDQQELIDDIIDQFEKYLHFLHVSPGSLPWNMQEHDEMISGTEEEAEGAEEAQPEAEAVVGTPEQEAQRDDASEGSESPEPPSDTPRS